MNLTGAIASLATGTYSVTRASAGSYDAHGRLVPGQTSSVQVTAAVSPVSGRELERLPESLRTRELLMVISTSQLNTANEPAGTAADVIAIGSDTYEVQRVKDWSAAGGFWECIVAKVPRAVGA